MEDLKQNMPNAKNVVIIGSGVAGYTAAIYASRSGLEPVLFAGSELGGQLTLTSDVENFPGFPDGVLGYDLMKNMQDQAEKFGTRVIYETVKSIALQEYPFKIEADSYSFCTLSLIIATGASAKWLNHDSEKLFMGKGVSACAVCDGAFYKKKDVVVVGGGDTAMEEALFLTKFASKVILIHRRDVFRASKIMQEKVLNHEKIEVIYNSVVEDIFGKEVVDGVKIKNIISSIKSTVPCKGVFVAIGHKPNTDVFKDSIELDAKGYVVTNNFVKSSVDGVFACGDVMDSVYRQAITAAGTGCMAALSAERFLESRKS